MKRFGTDEQSNSARRATVQSDRPHRPKVNLSTPIGRFLDKTSYRWLAIVIGLVITSSSFYYWIATPYGHGIKDKEISFVDSLYFSIITLSSLGYGDIVPVGYGRAVASFEVLIGLMLISIFVGKVASERQSTMLLLLHTSDHQRRIREFASDINTLAASIDNALTEHDHDSLFRYSKRCVRLLASLRKYLTFQANQGELASFGNVSSLRALYKSVATLQEAVFTAATIAETQDRTRIEFERSIERAAGISTVMFPFHDSEPKSRAILAAIQKLGKDFQKWEESRKTGTAVFRHRAEITEDLLRRVLRSLPLRPWPKNVHKTVAQELGIANKMAHRCISELVRRGHWPDINPNRTEAMADLSQSGPPPNNGMQRTRK